MRVVYLGRQSRRNTPAPSSEGDVIELLANNWDDYGYKTSFPVTARHDNKIVELNSIKLLIEGEYTSSTALDRLLEAGWDGTFPIPDTKYISVPSDITFYEQLDGHLGTEGALAIALALRDASYLVQVAEDDDAIALSRTDGFKNSLQRERGSTKAFLDGWRVFEQQLIAVLDLGFRFKDIYGDVNTLSLKFSSDGPLPHDINVLIGPNGHGKSQTLHQVVQDWISPNEKSETGFVEKPNLSQIVVISYSPFERFPVDLAGKQVQDTEAYRYFGFRGRSEPADGKRRGGIRISHEFPKKNAAKSLVDCLRDDKKYKSIRNWSKKLETVERVLRTAIDFDAAAVEIESSRRFTTFYDQLDDLDASELGFTVGTGEERRRYIPILADRVGQLDENKLSAAIFPDSGVTFFKEGEPIELSSGQRLFAYIVINVVGAIRRNSLILVDEPELFLHPTLEIQFIDMLKQILFRFNSKALLATHSVVTVREIPADCVHVFDKGDDELILKKPPFQTFGGDVQRISSYVFGDISVSKPFETWIEKQLSEYDSADDLIAALGDDVNEELIIQIRAMERD
ncbi:MAG: AAA family ATPase [Ancylobacter novellus]|uniref:AAA family ATPase n=1 Tax=Ancylobacter novellus TaxID=921 RepID=A0A2W5MEN4_ANCNO|nr:MAG: AAA family ATPase [Ancylobacter novellus]